jgi:hypothetical protein
MTDSTKSAEIRDALANQLLDILTKGVEEVDKETGAIVRVTPPASYLAVAKDYLKTFPPIDLPTPKSPTGILKDFVDNRLPFPTPAPVLRTDTKGH